MGVGWYAALFLIFLGFLTALYWGARLGSTERLPEPQEVIVFVVSLCTLVQMANIVSAIL